MRMTILFLACLGTIGTAWAQDKTATREVKSVDTETFKKLMDQSEGILVDIRTTEEINKSALEGNIQIDFYAKNFKEEIKKLDRDKTYFIYCRSGRRSGIALEFMRDQGFKSVYDLAGGILGWQAKNFPVVSKTE